MHELTRAPEFLGRERETAELCRLWCSDFAGVAALVGLGGMGKTALAARFLDRLAQGEPPLPAADSLLVWSFYREADAGRFLQEAAAYYAAATPTAARAHGLGLVHLLAAALADGGRHLLVLDGLERVQLEGEHKEQEYGRLEDPVLKAFLTRAASGLGRSLVLVTSRFPLTDLESAACPGYRVMPTEGLEPAAAVKLLRRAGVRGEKAALEPLCQSYGNHPLSLEHLGGVVGQFFGGDPTQAPELLATDAAVGDRQALRLSRLLRRYEEHLPPAELELLVRLCLFRRNLLEEQFLGLTVCSPTIRVHVARELAQAVPQCAAAELPAEERWLRDVAAAVRDTVESMALARTLAGPEAAFRNEALEVLRATLRSQKKECLDEAVSIARLYSDPNETFCDDERPLAEADRERLRDLFRRFVHLQRHPLMHPARRATPLLDALVDLGYGDEPGLRRDADLGPLDLMKAVRMLSQEISGIMVKHLVLFEIRQLCRRRHEKWQRGGSLAALDETALRQHVDSLVRRHLVMRAPGGSLEVHPAIRDHFRRLNDREAAHWHDAIREQLLSLARRPGSWLPDDTATLDMFEEAIDQALQVGRTDEAAWLYERALGGHKHLAWKLGEMARGLRILRLFPTCPNRRALAWYLRAFGEIDEAYRCHDMSYFRADVRLLQGRLPEVADELDPPRRAVARFLMGDVQRVPDVELGCVVPLGQVYLYLGRPDAALAASQVANLHRDFGWEGDYARDQLILAQVQVARLRAREAEEHVAEATGWIVHSGSMEHLALLHLTRAKAARIARKPAEQARAIDDGMHVARQCGFGLLRIELLCERAKLSLASGGAEAAEAQSREALALASAPDCRFFWGTLWAKWLVGESLAARQRRDEARAVFEDLLDDLLRIGHPHASETRRRLDELRD